MNLYYNFGIYIVSLQIGICVVSLYIHQIVLKRHLPWHCKKVLVILRCFHLLFIILINCDTKNIIDIGEVCMGAVYGRETWLEFLPVTKHEK